MQAVPPFFSLLFPEKDRLAGHAVLFGKRLVRDLDTLELRFFELRFSLDQLEDLLGPVACHSGSDRHHHAARFFHHLGCIAVAAVDDRLGVLHEGDQPLGILPLGDILQIGARQSPAADGVAVHAVLPEVVRRVLCQRDHRRQTDDNDLGDPANGQPVALLVERGREVPAVGVPIRPGPLQHRPPEIVGLSLNGDHRESSQIPVSQSIADKSIRLSCFGLTLRSPISDVKVRLSVFCGTAGGGSAICNPARCE